jgi:hypothetical protein
VQVLPLIAAFMPLDAAASVTDGVLLGSQEAGWMSRTMVVTAGACYAGLLLSQRMGWPLVTIWFVIKVRQADWRRWESLPTCLVRALMGACPALHALDPRNKKSGPSCKLADIEKRLFVRALQFLTVGRLVGNTWRLRSRHGPLATELAHA